MAIARGRADLRNHGAAYGYGWRRPAGYALFGCERIAGGWDGPDVLADERLPFGALAEADRQPPRRCLPALIRSFEATDASAGLGESFGIRITKRSGSKGRW